MMCRLALPVLVAALLPAVAAALPPPSTVKSERLIRQLGSNNYYEREAASKALRAIGKRALPCLRVACADKDAEVRKRARRLVDDMVPVRMAQQLEPTFWQVQPQFIIINVDGGQQMGNVQIHNWQPGK